MWNRRLNSAAVQVFKFGNRRTTPRIHLEECKTVADYKGAVPMQILNHRFMQAQRKSDLLQVICARPASMAREVLCEATNSKKRICVIGVIYSFIHAENFFFILNLKCFKDMIWDDIVPSSQNGFMKLIYWQWWGTTFCNSEYHLIFVSTHLWRLQTPCAAC